MGLEHHDGIVERYILAKGKPESLQITIKRLAKFMANEFGMKAYEYKEFWNTARSKLRMHLTSGYAMVDVTIYKVQRVEAWPEYKLAFEVEGIDNGEG